MNLMDIDLSHYGLGITGFDVHIEHGIENASIGAVALFPSPLYSTLIKDITVMNKVRLAGPGSPEYTAYEQLLTILALKS